MPAFKTLTLFAIFVSSHALYYRKDFLADHCDHQDGQLTLDGSYSSSALVHAVRPYSKGYFEANVTCGLRVSPPKFNELGVHVQLMAIDNRFAKLQLVSGEEVLYDTDQASMSNVIITEFLAEDELRVVLITKERVLKSTLDGVELIITAFLPKPKDGHCPSLYYFDCNNGRCIRESLRCDDRSNCGHGDLDERHCRELAASSLLLIFSVILVLMMVFVYKTFQVIIGEATSGKLRQERKLGASTRSSVMDIDLTRGKTGDSAPLITRAVYFPKRAGD